MKTAMQELRDSINTSYTHMNMARETKDIHIYKIALKEALDKIDVLIEKEKEQIIDACNSNLKGLLTNGKDYYDLNFNHHIELESNTYTNFTPHNANAVAEYNDSLKNFTPNQNK